MAGGERRVPPFATAIVALAVLVMIALGVWQLRRAEWKGGVIAQAAAAVHQPEVAWPAVPVEEGAPLFRRSALTCLSVEGWRAASGRNAADEPGWIHIAACRTGAEGPGAQVVAGWSTTADAPAWGGGPVSGTIAPDSRHVIRLVADRGLGGLQAAAPPSVESIPNNHRAYAVQWFAFAAIAVLVYALALRRRGGTGR